jgi:hypothetical protein
MYMGQWDAIKEHMVWGIMEKNKELNIFNVGMGEATLKGADHMESTQPCNILCSAPDFNSLIFDIFI